MFPPASVCEQDVCIGERAWVSNEEKQQVGELQCFSAVQQRPAQEITQPNFLNQECRITAIFHCSSDAVSPPCLLLACVKAPREQNQPSLPLWVQLIFYVFGFSCNLFGGEDFLFRVFTGSGAVRSVSITSSATWEQQVPETWGRSRALYHTYISFRVLPNMQNLGSGRWHDSHFIAGQHAERNCSG